MASTSLRKNIFSKLDEFVPLLFTTFAGSCIPESLGKRIVVNLELGDLLILIGRHPDELALLEDVGAEGGVGQLHDVAGSHQVEPGLVLVHRVQDGLKVKKKISIIQYTVRHYLPIRGRVL